jgi:RND family efflux transporter MFP subunit
MKNLIVFLLLIVTSQSLQAATYKGRLEWIHKVELRVLESGVIKHMDVTVGQFVKKGAVLLMMDQREARAKLQEAKARVARAKIAGEDARREYQRTQELFDRGLIAEEELKDAELKKAIAAADEESAKANEAAKTVALEYTELRAPFNGIILARNKWQGDVIYKSLQQTPPIIIAPSGQMLARILVTADVLRKYKKGQPVNLIIKGKPYKGSIYSLGVESVRIDPNGAVYEMDIIFNRDNRIPLRQAEVVQVTLPR